jgi:signal transduction histidine kinase
MPKALLTILFLFFTIFSVAQEEVEHYKKIVETTGDKQLKLAALDSILGITWKERNFNDFIDYTFTYVELAENLGEYEQLAKKAMNATHPITTFRNDPQLAVALIDKAITYESKLTDNFLKGGLYLRRGRAYVRFDTQKAIDDYDKALEIFGEEDDAYKADAHLFRGQAYSNQGLFVQASDDYKKAYDYYEKANIPEYMLHARSGEIIMYSKNGFIEKAIAQRDELIQDIKKLKLYQYLSIHLYNQSIDYKKLNNDNQRYQLLNEALTFADSSNNPTFNYTAIYSSLSEHFSLNNNLQKAAVYLAKAEVYLPEIPNDRYANSIYLMAAIQYHINTNNLDLAKEKAIERLEVLETLGIDEETISTHQTLSELYLKLGDKENAYTHLNLHITLKDSLFNQSKTNALIYYQTLYETERKEKELFENRSSIALLEEKNNSMRRQYVFGGVTVTLGFILLFLYKNQRDLKSKKEMNEKYTQDLLMAQEDERKRISKDLHDGIGQSLLLIKNKVVLNKDDNAKSMVENAIEEVRSISRALHPFQLQELGITKAIQNIIYQVDESSELFITSEIENIDGLFNLQQEVNIYRIVQESFNNILKHSKATGVKIDIQKMQKQIQLTIKDNGKGFDFSDKYIDFKSIGLKTLKERSRLLKGTMKVESQPGKGTSLEFLIPY